jgi:hypothetical protein
MPCFAKTGRPFLHNKAFRELPFELFDSQNVALTGRDGRQPKADARPDPVERHDPAREAGRIVTAVLSETRGAAGAYAAAVPRVRRTVEAFVRLI